MRIMLVEDHVPTREYIKALLSQEADLTVVAEAGSAEAGITEFSRCQPDVVVMDLLLPMMNGIDATRHILATRPETRILVLSNHSGAAVIKAVLEAGSLGYVRKNCASEELIPALRAVGAGKSYLGAGAR